MSEILDENAISVVPTTIVLEPLPEIPDNDSFRLETPANTRIQRRKRTSPRDHATLEAAYHQNSKPDKEERAALVRQTELTEKEVQVMNAIYLPCGSADIDRYGSKIEDKMIGGKLSPCSHMSLYLIFVTVCRSKLLSSYQAHRLVKRRQQAVLQMMPLSMAWESSRLLSLQT